MRKSKEIDGVAFQLQKGDGILCHSHRESESKRKKRPLNGMNVNERNIFHGVLNLDYIVRISEKSQKIGRFEWRCHCDIMDGKPVANKTNHVMAQ